MILIPFYNTLINNPQLKKNHFINLSILFFYIYHSKTLNKTYVTEDIMKNKNVGMLTIGIAILIGFIVFSFNRALTKIVDTTCTHGSDCPMWGTINFQTNIGIGVMAFIVMVDIPTFLFG